MGRGGTSAREISFVSFMAYGPNSDSALTTGGYSLFNQAGRFPTGAHLRKKWLLDKCLFDLIICDKISFGFRHCHRFPPNEKNLNKLSLPMSSSESTFTDTFETIWLSNYWSLLFQIYMAS